MHCDHEKNPPENVQAGFVITGQNSVRPYGSARAPTVLFSSTASATCVPPAVLPFESYSSVFVAVLKWKRSVADPNVLSALLPNTPGPVASVPATSPPPNADARCQLSRGAEVENMIGAELIKEHAALRRCIVAEVVGAGVSLHIVGAPATDQGYRRRHRRE
jgi:hypothetical protein